MLQIIRASVKHVSVSQRTVMQLDSRPSAVKPEGQPEMVSSSPSEFDMARKHLPECQRSMAAEMLRSDNVMSRVQPGDRAVQSK